MKKSKKIIIICTMVVLLVATTVLNIVLNDKAKANTVSNDQTDVVTVSHFDSYRADRTSSRNEQMLLLDSMISSETTDVQSKESAEALKLELIETMESELVLEGLIKAQGFSDAVISMNDNSINIVVNSSELTESEVAKIVSVVVNETEYSPEQVVVYPYA